MAGSDDISALSVGTGTFPEGLTGGGNAVLTPDFIIGCGFWVLVTKKMPIARATAASRPAT